MEKKIPTYEEFMAMLDRQAVEAAERAAEADKRAAKAEEEMEALREQMEETDRRMKETDRQMKETDKRIFGINEKVEGIGESNGRFSESYFYNSLYNSMAFGGKNFDAIEKGLKRAQKQPDGKKIKGEYDVVMYNGDTIALIEVKYKVQKEHFEKLRTKQLSVFKELFPQYKDYSFYLGIAGLSFEDGTEKTAEEYGIGILRPKGESVEILDKKLKVY
jgi:hypothetical protein